MPSSCSSTSLEGSLSYVQPILISCGISGSDIALSLTNSSNNFKFVCGTFIEICIKLAGFSLSCEVFTLCSKSSRVVWPINVESKYLLHTLFSWLSQNQMMISICSDCRTLFRDSSNEMTYFTLLCLIMDIKMS